MIGGSRVRGLVWWRLALVVPAALLSLGVVFALADSGRNASFSVGLIAREFLFEPKDVTAGTGEIAFFVKNQGAVEHNLVLVAPGGKTQTLISVIEPGQTMRVAVSLSPGLYSFYCSLPGHKDAGMTATLHVIPQTRSNTPR
jgi:plastocyanin